MPDLVDEVKESFANLKHINAAQGSVVMVSDTKDFSPGFTEARAYYNKRVLVHTRHGYRHFAGSSMPTDGEQVVITTNHSMGTRYMALMFSCYCDGVRIGHHSDPFVATCFADDAVEAMFDDVRFREPSNVMAAGFAKNSEIAAFFTEFFTESVVQISRACGFKDTVEPAKVWDLWLMVGTSVVSACYLAGHRLGVTWKERDVLSDIEIELDEPKEI